MDKDLEGTKPQVEGAKPTQAKVESTIRTYTQKELDEAVGKGVSSIQRQLSQRDAETKAGKAQADAQKAVENTLNEQISDLERRLEAHYDPDELKLYRVELREKRATLKEAELRRREEEDKAEKIGWLYVTEMEAKKKELQTQYQAPDDILEACISIEQMEKIAKAFPEVGAVRVEKTPKFDSGVSSGGGMSDDQIREAYRNNPNDPEVRARYLTWRRGKGI